ncbi:MAG: metallophosphoesterase [Rhodococcus sp. (in: high G+C Gram-positive bacteria)]
MPEDPASSEAPDATPGRPPVARLAVVFVILAILFGVPLWTLVFAGSHWPAGVRIVGTVGAVAAAASLIVGMTRGHGRAHSDRWARIGDTLLGLVWIAFVWSVLGIAADVVLLIAGVDDPVRSRIVSLAVLVVVIGLAVWGREEALRLPRVKHVTVTLDRLGHGLDGVRIVLVTDTHFGPIERSVWSADVVAEVNRQDADIVCHLGDLADGSVERRRAQVAPLERVSAKSARVYVTGNHEYFGEAQEWLDHMTSLGWDSLHNRHIEVMRGGDRLVVAGVDDRTARGSGEPGHGADLTAALTGANPSLPVFLLAHQPKQITAAVDAGVDLQVSGHTHGGQIWPFGLLVRLDQPVVSGLSRHGTRTQLYTSRGTGFWGPPFRVFAPSEITVLTLRCP